MWLDVKKVCGYCGVCKQGEEDTEEKDPCKCEIKLISGPCGSIFNEFVTSFIGEFLIYPSTICNLIGFINGRS